MGKTDKPIKGYDKDIKRRKESDEHLVSSFGRDPLLLLFTTGEPDISEEYRIAQHCGHNEGVVDEDPSSESSDTNTHGRAGGNGRHQECSQGQEESYQETHPTRNNLK